MIFLMKYVAVLAALLLIFYFPLSYNLSFLLEVHTALVYDMVVKILQLFDKPFVFYSNSIGLPNGFVVDIIDDCNAFLPFLVFVGGIIVLPLKRLQKILLIFVGWILMMFLNIVRIVVIVWITSFDKHLFSTVHDVASFVSIGIFAIVIYGVFVKLEY